jgi:hypothetical protein
MRDVIIPAWLFVVYVVIVFFAGMGFERRRADLYPSRKREQRDRWIEFVSAMPLDENGCPPCDNAGGPECCGGPLEVCKRRFLAAADGREP